MSRRRPGENLRPPYHALVNGSSRQPNFDCSTWSIGAYLVLVSSEVDATTLGAGLAVDVGVDVLLEVADDSGRQSGKGTGIDAAAVSGAER